MQKTVVNTYLIIIFAIIAGVEMSGEYLYHYHQQKVVLFASKPLLMPVLIGLLWVGTRFQTTFDKLVLTGLIFGWLGDILLMFNDNDLFVFGLAAFLIGHIMYILAFANNIRKSGYKASGMNRFILALLPLFYLVVLYGYLYPYIVNSETNKPFLIPVSVYAVTIVTMTLYALWRIGSSNRTSVALIITGAFVFIISDSLIAINKFVEPIPYANLFIMFTYCLAQLWIVTGSILHHKKAKV